MRKTKVEVVHGHLFRFPLNVENGTVYQRELRTSKCTLLCVLPPEYDGDFSPEAMRERDEFERKQAGRDGHVVAFYNEGATHVQGLDYLSGGYAGLAFR